MPAHNPFTEEEKDFIRENFAAMTLRDIAKALDRSEGGVKSWSLKLGLRRGTRFDWTEDRVAVLIEFYPNHSAKYIAELLGTNDYVIYKKAYSLRLRKSPEYLASLNRQMGENLQKNGFGSRFVKGHKSWNSGKKIGSHPNSAKTQFKKGQTPHNYQPVGTILPVSLSPYLKIKIADPNKWEFLHRHNYEKAKGRIPTNFVVWFIDQNPKNCAVENLELITRKELGRRTSKLTLPPELQHAYRTLGRLKQAIKKFTKKEKENA